MTPKKLQAKKRHHYVWRQYLNQWSGGTPLIYFSTSLRKIVHDSPKGVAVADYFYKVRPLNERQWAAVFAMSQSCAIDNQKLHLEFLEDILKLQSFEELYRRSGFRNKKIDEMLHVQLCNFIEDYHGDKERAMSPILKKLLSEDLSVLDNLGQLVHFFDYFGHQIARTKNFRNIFSQIAGVSDSVQKEYMQLMDETSWLVTLLLGMNLGINLFLARDKYHYAMLINETSTPFITSDQPVVNVYTGAREDLTASPELSDFYYPLSPKLAIVLCETDRFKPGRQIVDSATAHELNRSLAEKAHVHLVGADRAHISPYVHMPGMWNKRWTEANGLPVHQMKGR